MSKIVIALGGNALGNTLPEQFEAVKITSKAIVDLMAGGNQILIVHGNGPQVGIINNAMSALQKEDPAQGFTPLSVCGAMSQAYIGYDLQNALLEELKNRDITDVPVSTVLTQVVVDPEDPAFSNLTKPIGKFMSEEDAKVYAEKTGYTVKEDAGRGWRRYVASPKPQDIVELTTIKTLSEAGQLVICCGGGGIPVFKQGNHCKGAGAVIDKDFCSELLAELLDADMLIILTAVEKVAINFNKENEEWLSTLTPDEARAYAAEGQFAPGSMLPKVEACVKFAESKPGRVSMITSLEKASEGLAGKTGTRIVL